MTISRIFQPVTLKIRTSITLDEAATHHLARVLRAKIGEIVIIFNGEGGEYAGVITHIDKKAVTVELQKFIDRDPESALELILVQGISRGEKMDFTIQKAVELGVKQIIPVLTARCNVKLDEERRDKRWQHWQSVAVSACEQSGRTRVPDVLQPQTLATLLANIQADCKLMLAPRAEKKLRELPMPKNARVVLLIGPEGGLSDAEIALATQAGFTALSLGPRILRTETAAIAGLVAVQCFAGDL